MQNKWPENIRQWTMSPIAGGWSGSYTSGEYSTQASGAKPMAVLRKIASYLMANDLEVDVDDIKWELEKQWYKREPSRFTRPPVPPPSKPKASLKDPPKEVDNVRLMNAVSSFLNLSYRSSLTLEDFSALMLEVFNNKQIGCSHCADIIRAIAVSPGDDWRYEIQAKLSEHFNLPIKPKQLIKKEWCLD